jgi:hypothetical protein
LENSATVSFWLKSAPAGQVTVELSTVDGSRSVSHRVDAHAGVNRWYWDLRWAPSAGEVQAFEARMARFREQFGGQLPAFFGNQGPQGAVVDAGTYVVRLTAGGRTVEGILTVRDDPGLDAVLPSVR